MSKFFNRQKSKISSEVPTSEASSSQSSSSNVDFKEARELWDSYTQNEISYPVFTAQFLQLFEKTSSIVPPDYKVHPQDVVVHACQQLLIHVWVEYGTHTLEAEDFLLRSKLKSTASKEFSVTLKNVFTETKYALSKEFHSNRHQLLLSIHLVSQICKWSLNRDFIVNYFGANFFLLIIEMIRVLISQLEDQIVVWSDCGNKLKDLKGEALGAAAGDIMENTHNELRCDGLFIISALLGLVQICGHVCGSAGFNVAHYAVGSLSSQTWDYSDYKKINIDVFLNYSSAMQEIETTTRQSLSMPNTEASPASPKPKTPTSPTPFKTSDKTYFEAIQVLVVLLRKLFYFSKAACLFEEECRKISSTSCSSSGGDAPVLVNGGVNSPIRLILALQCEVLHTASNCLSSRPVAYSQFRICDGPSIVQAHLTMTDMGSLLSSKDAIDSELIFQRSLLVMLCHEICVVAGFKAPKLEYKEAIIDMQHALNGLSPTIKWLVDKLNSEVETGYVEQSVDNAAVSGLMKKYSIECLCPGRLSSSLPVTDVYPWNAPNTSNGQFDISAQNAQDLKVMNQFLSTAALSNLFGAYWNKRNSESNTSDARSNIGSPQTVKNALHALFEPDKSVICSVLQSSKMHNPLYAYQVKEGQASPASTSSSSSTATVLNTDTSILSPLISFPTCEMVSHFLMILYKISWMFQDNQFHPQDSLVFIKDTMKLFVKTLQNVKESDGSNIFQVFFLIFIARCVKKSPQHTILSCRNENIWRSLFKINKVFGTEERASSKLVKNKMYKVSRLAPDPNSATVTHSHDGHDVAPYKVSWSPANALKKLSTKTSQATEVVQITPITPIVGSSGSLEGMENNEPSIEVPPPLIAEKSTSAISFTGLPTEADELAKTSALSNEFMSSFLKVVLKDMILELLWLYSSCNYLLLTANQTPQADGRMPTYSSTNDSEAIELLDALSGTSGDDSVLMIVRWFNNLLDFHRRHLMMSSVWSNVVKKCVNLCKFHLDSMNSTAQSAGASNTGENSIHQRPLFWPARAGVIQLINKIMFSSIATNWVDVFIPINNFNDKDRLGSRSGTNNSDGGGSSNSANAIPVAAAVPQATAIQGPSLQSKLSVANVSANVNEGYFVPTPAGASTPGGATSALTGLVTPISISNINTSHSAQPSPAKHIKHVVILRLILDPLCRDFALSIIVKILFECAKTIAMAAKDSEQGSGQPSIYEALGHDILKGLFNTIKNAPQQPEYNDGFGAVTLTLQALTVFLRNPILLFEESVQSINNSMNYSHFQRLFQKYGTSSPQHALFGWKHGRGNVFRDLVVCLEASFIRTSLTAWRWTEERKTSIVRRSLAFMTALMIGNDSNKEIFKQQMMSRKKRKTTNSVLTGLSGVAPLYRYHDFIGIIVSGQDSRQEFCSPEIILILMEMMLDGFSTEFRENLIQSIHSGQLNLPENGLFEGQQDVPRIENLTVIPILLHVMLYCDSALQFCILDTLYNLIGGSSSSALINLSKCTAIQPPVLELILDIFPQLSSTVQMKSVKLLQAIGKQTISVAQLKRVFRLMQVKDGCRPVYTWSLLDAIEGMILDAEVPKYYLFFQGKNSGLRLPSFRRWPATSGYSFSTWFCIDNSGKASFHRSTTPELSVDSRFTSRSDSNTEVRYNPRLLCFRQENGLGLEIFFKPVETSESTNSTFHIVVVLHSSKGTAPTYTIVGTLNKTDSKGLGWHHFAMAHTASSFRSKSELVVLLDGVLSKHPVSFPRFSDEVKFPTIGDVSPSFKEDSTNTTFLGQISAIYFFSESISESYLRGIYSLGPTYSQLFSDREGVYRNNGSSHHLGEKVISKALDGTLTPLIMLTYNPGVRKGNFFIDNSPEQNASKWKPTGFYGEKFYDEPCEAVASGAGATSSGSKSDASEAKNMNARRLEGTYICTTKDMRDSLDCLGGIKVLLPLFTQLSLPVASDAVSFFNTSPNKESNSEQTQRLYVKILQVFFALLRGTAENYRLMNESGFSILAYFMDTLGPKLITISILDALIMHCDNLADNQDWQNDFFEHIFCNFKLWIFTSYEIQRKLMNYLLQFAGSNVNKAYRVVQVRRLFDSLYVLYSSQAIQRMTTGSKSRSDDTFLPKQWAQYYTLTNTELSDIRSSVWQMIYIIMSSTVESIDDEVNYLMCYITNETIAMYKVEGLQLLLRMINPEKADLGHKLLAHFCAKKCVYKLLDLCHGRAKVRLYATICMCSVVQLALMLGKLPTAPVAIEKLPQEVPITGLTPSISIANLESLSTRETVEPFTPGATSNLTYASIQTPQSRWVEPKEVSPNVATESDVFESLGMPMKSLTSYFLWMQDQLKNEMLNDKFTSESNDKQSYIIFTAMQLTMHGHSCKYLINDVEHILSNRSINSGEPTTPNEIKESLSSELGDMPSAPFAKPEKTSMEEEVEINFEFSRICIPMIIPALFEFVRNINDVKRRIQLILRLKNSMYGFENMDTVLSIPGWQASILVVLSQEQSRLVELEGESVDPKSRRMSKDYSGVRNVLDVLFTMMSDIHIHAVRFGAPSISFFGIVKPSDVSDIQYHKVSTRELLEVMKKDNRKVGCTVLKETISCVRSYATQGEIDAQITGLELLQNTVEALQRESDTIINSVLDPMELNIRRKLLELNLWLISAFILEFITLPPTQPARATRNLMSSPSSSFQNIAGKFSTKITYSRRASTNSDPAELTKPRGQSEDVTTNTTNSTNDISSNSNDSLGSLEALEKIKLTSPDRPMPQSAEKAVSSIAKRRSSLGTMMINPSISSKDFEEADILSLLKDKAPAVSTNQHSVRVWQLVESLLNLLGPMENFNNAWFSSDMKDRLRTGMKVGIRLGRSVANQIQESVDTIISQHVNAGSTMMSPHKGAPNKGNTSAKVSAKDSPLSRAIDAVFWIILRVLIKIFVQGGLDSEEIDESSAAMKAAKRLLTFMEWAKEGSRDYYEMESMFIITKVTEALRMSAQPPRSLWTKQALSIVSSKLVMQKQNIITKLNILAQSDRNSISQDLASKSEFIQILQRPSQSSTTTDDPIEDDITSQKLKTSLSGAPMNAEIRNKVIALCDTNEDTTASITLEMIRIALQLPNDGKFTWQLWNSGMEPILKETQKNEELMLSSKLTDLGLHRHAQEMTTMLEMQKQFEAHCFSTISSKVDESTSKVVVFENKHLREASRFEEANRKKYAAHWNTINEELAHERGPWGVGADAQITDALWTIDPCEDNSRMKPKLGKNSHGTQYLRDFLIANAAISESIPLPSGSKPPSPVTIQESEPRALGEELAEEGDNSGLSEETNLTLIKKLRQFQGDSKKETDYESDEEIQESIENDSMPDVDAKKTEAAVAPVVADGEKVLFHAECEVVTANSNSTNMPSFGYLEITKTKVTFTRSGESMSPSSSGKNRVKRQESIACESLWACQPFPSTQWSTSEIVNIHQRYYQLRFVAIEIFTTSRKTIFFNLFEQKVASNCQVVLRRDVKPPYMAPFIGKRPTTIVQRSTAPGSVMNLSTAWANRDISNFEYLMRLNTIAGRTYNDLGQYPVFPWILSDYTSDVLDLKNPASFRDLSWPMGAQDIKQRQMIQTKYADLKSMYVFDEEDNGGASASMPPFHYGTHYSVAGFVLWFLIRLEPYTSLHVQLQDGRIDRPDRLFDSLDAAWKGCTSNPSDVKELIPEMFYCPEVLKNINGVDFGITQTNKKVDDIVLPTWAKDPYDFIFKHREALESEYVSLNLHHWIDLIFGYKQRPPHLPGGDEAAVDFCNVYFHLTYENAVDLETLRTTNAALYQQYVCQISEFGQTPCQLFTKPHIARLPLNQVDIIWPIASIVRGVHTLINPEETPVKPRKIICFKEFKVSVWPLIFIGESSDRLITVDSTRILGYHSWQILSPDVVPPFKLKLDHAAVELATGQVSISSMLRVPNYNSSNSLRDRRIGVPFAPSQSISTSSGNSGGGVMRSNSSDPTQTPWRPVKIRSYEKEEKLKKSQGKGLASTLPPSVPSTPISIKRKGGHDKEGLIMASTAAPNTSGKITRLRSESEVPENALNSGSRKQISSLLQSTSKNSSSVLDDHLSSRLFAYYPESKLLFSAGHWDHSFKITSAETGKLIQSVVQHSDVITCIATVKDFGQSWLVTGSRDCTLMIWEILPDKEVPLGQQPIHILYGHDDAVTCVTISAELDIVVSGSDDGTIIIHNLRDGMYVRSIVDGVKDIKANLDWEGAEGSRERAISMDETGHEMDSTPSTPKSSLSNSVPSTPSMSRTSSSATLPTGNVPHRKITWIGLSKENYLITYSADDLMLCTYSLNGHQIATHIVPEALYAFLISEDGKVLITGGSSCLVVFRWIHNLELANDGPRQGLEATLDGSMEENVIPPFASPIRSLYLTKMERHLLVGLESGELRILAQDSDYLRQRLQRKLIEIGIL